MERGRKDGNERGENWGERVSERGQVGDGEMNEQRKNTNTCTYIYIIYMYIKYALWIMRIYKSTSCVYRGLCI